ncbi:MAG TPA: extracellular solute-binding protein, partial [Candidatus Binatus sp.]|nr:extracellular solute-binding protein [Candidatus Binatus sp.]
MIRTGKFWQNFFATFFLAIALGGVHVSSAVEAAIVEEIALSKASNRQTILVEGAKKEGKLLWYTTLIVNQALKPLKEAFEKKYPFVQVEFHRADSDQLAQRMLAEYQAKKFDVDMLDGTSTIVMLKKAGYIQRFGSPLLREYPARLKDAQGYWAVPNVYFMTLGYNTKLVKPNEVPRTAGDLLDSRWNGKMIWSTSGGSGAPIFIGNILMTMGQEAAMAYLKKLAGQNIAKSTASNRAVLDMVIAEEYAIAINIFNYHAVISRTGGAPVDWQALEPVPGQVKTLGLARNAPHPHAAMLMIDFLLSKDGQKIFQEADYLPAHPEVPAKTADLKPGGGKFSKVNYLGPELLYEKEAQWVEL